MVLPMADWQGGTAPRKSGIGWCGIVLLIAVPAALVVFAAAGIVVYRAAKVFAASGPLRAGSMGLPSSRPPAATEIGLAAEWSCGTLCSGVATDSGEGVVYVADGSQCVRLDRDGKELARLSLGEPGRALRAGQLDTDPPLELVAFTYFSDPMVQAYDDDGSELWSHTAGYVICDAAVSDLDGDGVDEVLIGLGDPPGVGVVGRKGTEVWRVDMSAEVPFVSGGDVDDDGDVDVVAHVQMERVQFYEADGTEGRVWNDVSRLEFARAVQPPDGAVRLLVTGADETGEAAFGIGADGGRVWRTALNPGETSYLGPCEVARSAGLVAMSAYGGTIVLDLATGERVASASGPYDQSETAWLETEGEPPLLLVMRGGAVTAYTLGEPKPRAEAESAEAGGESGAVARWRE